VAQLKAGLRLRSAVSEVEVIVVKAGADHVITCGGAPMLIGTEAAPTSGTHNSDETPCQLGKRYVNASGSVEVVCVKGGKGAIAVDGEPLQVKAAKALPSSD
jgi:hypothetical protein